MKLIDADRLYDSISDIYGRNSTCWTDDILELIDEQEEVYSNAGDVICK